MAAAPPDPADIVSVAALTARIRNALEGEFGSVWVSGEISNLSRPSSGHSSLQYTRVWPLSASSIRAENTSTSSGGAMRTSICTRSVVAQTRRPPDRAPMRNPSPNSGIAGAFRRTGWACWGRPSGSKGDATAGLAAERGFNLWASHRGWCKKNQFLEVFDPLRAALFYTNEPVLRDPFPSMLLSPFHVVTNLDVTGAQSGNELLLKWMSRDERPQAIRLLFAATSVLPEHNVKSVQVVPRQNESIITVQPIDVGPTSIKLIVPPGLKLPEYVSAPPYEEVRR